MLTMLPFPAQSTAFVEGSAQAASGAVQTSAASGCSAATASPMVA